MPANLTPNYLAAEARFRAAETVEDRLAALDDMYATIPKHKGTEKLRADIKKRISKLKDKEKQLAPKGKRFDDFYVDKEGAGQIVLLGPPNSGKSMLLGRLTAAEPEVADYPFTTKKPLPGMMEYEDMHIQLVDLPPVEEDHAEGGVVGLVRNTDSVVLVVDVSDDTFLNQIEEIREVLSKSRIVLAGEYTPHHEYPTGTVAKLTLIVANKMDHPSADDNLELLRESYADEFIIQGVSAITGDGIKDLKGSMFESLGIIRVYTKVPGKPVDYGKPFILKKGSTLVDFAAAVHKDFAHSLRYAKAWGKDILDGAQIGKDHIMEDGYVVELHI